MRRVEEKLSIGPNRGVARFENDGYMRVSDELPGNAWFICTLWLAEYYIARRRQPSDRSAGVTGIMEWCAERPCPPAYWPSRSTR